MTTGEVPQRAAADYEAFVSYSRPDREAVRRLESALRARGRRVWVDWEGIPPTAEWMAEIREAIDAADAVLFVLSPTSVVSQVCAQEVEHAVARNKRIVPVLVQDVDAAVVPHELSKRNWVLLREGDDFERGVEQIVAVLDTDIELVKRHTRLSVRAAEWDASGRSSAKLLRGADLTEAESWLVAPGKGPEPTPEQAALVTVSRQAASRGQRRLITAVSLTLVGALVLGVFSFVQRNNAVKQRNVAQTQALASASLAHMESDPEASILYALEAAKHGRTPLLEQALRQSVLASHVEKVFVPGQPGQRLGDLAFSADGTKVYATTFLAVFEIDIATGAKRVVMRREAGTGPVFGLTVVHDDVLAMAGMGVQVFHAGTGKAVPMNEGGGAGGFMYNVAAAPDGHSIFVPQQNGVAVQWDVTHAGGLLHTYGVPAPFVPGIVQSSTEAYDAQPSPDGTRVAVAGGDGKVGVFDVATARLQLSLAPGSSTSAARWSPDGKRIATVSRDRIARVWDATSGALVQEFGSDAQLEDLAWATDEYLVTVDRNGHGRVLSVDSGEVLSELRGHTAAIANAVASPDGSRVATSSDDGTVRVWRLGVAAPTHTRRAADTITGVAVTPDSRTIVSASFVDGTVVSDGSTGTTRRVLDKAGVEAPVLSPAGDRAAVLVADGSPPAVRLYDVVTSRRLWSQNALGTYFGAQWFDDVNSTPHDRQAWPRAAAFSPDGSRLAVLTEIGCVVLDAATGKVLLRYFTPPIPEESHRGVRDFGHLYGIVWDPHGRFIALPNGPDIVLLKPDDLTETLRLPGTDGSLLEGLAVSADGTRLVASDFGGSVRTWDATSGRLLRTLDLGVIAHGIALNDAGDLATTDNEGFLRVWGPDAALLLTARMTSVQAMAVAWAPDGRHLVVGTGEGRDERTGFGSDDPLLVSGRVAVVDCEVCRPFDELLAFARTRVTRALSDDEVAAALGGRVAVPVAPTATSTTPPEESVSPGRTTSTTPSPTPRSTLTPSPPPAALVGDYRGLTVYPNGRFWYSGGSGITNVQGQELQVSTAQCDGQIGHYEWTTVGSTQLRITVVSDPCQDRKDAPLAGLWTRR